jgi:hypothetical protein
MSFGAATLMALVCISACGADAGSATNPDSESSVSASGNETGASRTPTGNATGGSKTGGSDDRAAGFPYTPWGPDDPPIPGQYAALAASPGTPPRCDAVADAQPGGAFWATAVAVCRAISGEGPWPATTTVPAPPAPANPYQACLDDELRAMLERALAWRAENPDRQPKVSYPDKSSRSPCQSRIYDVKVLGAADLDPGEGQPDGIALAVTGTGMEGDVSVTVDGIPAEFSGDFTVPDPGAGLTTVVVLTAQPPTPRSARVQVSTERGSLVATVELPGSEPSGDGSQPEPSPSETAS